MNEMFSGPTWRIEQWIPEIQLMFWIRLVESCILGQQLNRYQKSAKKIKKSNKKQSKTPKKPSKNHHGRALK